MDFGNWNYRCWPSRSHFHIPILSAFEGSLFFCLKSFKNNLFFFKNQVFSIIFSSDNERNESGRKNYTQERRRL